VQVLKPIISLGPLHLWMLLKDLCFILSHCSSRLLQIDESPVDGNVFDRVALEQLQKEGVTLVCSIELIHSQAQLC
jgi:hypothetical protein